MTWIRRHSLVGFFAVTFALQVMAVWLEAKGMSPSLLVRARIYFPALVAIAFFFLVDGTAGVVKLAKSLTKFKVPLKWYLFALLWAPTLSIAPIFLFKALGLKEHVEYDANVFGDEHALWFLKFIITISIVEEISWVSFGIERISKSVPPFVACLIGGAMWGLWYVPLNQAGIQVAGTFPNAPMVVNFMAIGCATWWLYHQTQSAMIVALMQVMTNYAALVFPVLPRPGEEAIYYAFVGIKCAIAVLLFLIWGPLPLFRRPRGGNPMATSDAQGG